MGWEGLEREVLETVAQEMGAAGTAVVSWAGWGKEVLKRVAQAREAAGWAG